MTEDRQIDPVLDPVLLRGLTQRRVGRRDVLRLAGLSGGAVLLGACGVKGQGAKQTAGVDEVKKYWQDQKPTGQLNFANWPLYIDVNDNNKSDHPSLDQFGKASDVKVKYYEVIQDNGPFFAKVQPSLSSGEYCGYDMAVISNGIYFDRLRQLGFLVELDQSRLANFRKYAHPKYQDRSYDKGNVFSVPWAAGFTGIGYDPKRTGRAITSWQDLLDPKFKGKIGMFGNNEDLPNCAMFAIGVNPETSTEADWRKAADWLRQQKPLVRQYYDQNYVDALAKGDIWVTMAWSGDIFQQNLSGSNLKFVQPKEGALFWIDNMLILKYAQNPVSAMELMDFYYEPDKAAELAEYVNYICPVPDAKQTVLDDAKAAKGDDRTYLESIASSPAVFPTDTEYSKANLGRSLTTKEIDTWNGIFEPIYQS